MYPKTDLSITHFSFIAPVFIISPPPPRREYPLIPDSLLERSFITINEKIRSMFNRKNASNIGQHIKSIFTLDSNHYSQLKKLCKMSIIN